MARPAKTWFPRRQTRANVKSRSDGRSDKATAPAEIGVYGAASGDADFAASGDRVRYAVDVPAAGPYSVEVELRYQSIGFRWAHNLEGYDAPEPRRFLGYYRSMSSTSSVVVATARASD